MQDHPVCTGWTRAWPRLYADLLQGVRKLKPGLRAWHRGFLTFILFIFLKHCWNFSKALFHFLLKLATSESPVSPSLSHGTLGNCSRVALCGPSVWPAASHCGHYLASGARPVSGLGCCPVSCRMSSSTPWVHPLDAGGTPPSLHNHNTSRFGRMSPVGNHCLESHNPAVGWLLCRSHTPAP